MTCDIGLSPMHVAAQNSSSETLEVFIECGKTLFHTFFSGAQHAALNNVQALYKAENMPRANTWKQTDSGKLRKKVNKYY